MHCVLRVLTFRSAAGAKQPWADEKIVTFPVGPHGDNLGCNC